MAIDWAAHKAHREHVVATRGQWIGLLDENGIPLMDMPSVVDATAANAVGSAEEIELSFSVAGRTGVTHRAVAELIADNLGKVDAAGRLIPAAAPTRFITVQRPGLRYTYRVTHCTAEGDQTRPHTLRVHGLHVASLLELIPAWSVPLSITGKWHRLDRDYAAAWTREMVLQDLQLAAQADGFTITGPALATIYRLVSDSLAATWTAIGLNTDPPIQVAAIDNAASPTVMLRPQDDSVWDTITDPAMAAGVRIDVGMWLPGDDMPPGLELVSPTVVVTLRQTQQQGDW